MPNSAKSIKKINSDAIKWLTEYALPLWSDKGVDRDRGGYFESLDSEDLTCPADYKRVRVLARQIYVFAVGCDLSQHYCKQVVIHGLDFLLNKARVSSGGYASRLNLSGKVIDDNLDLYDLAFCLFALAHGYRLLGEPLLKDEAVGLMTFISDRLAHPSGGFREDTLGSLPRRQNPHMHLLEALLEWRAVSDHVAFVDLSDLIVKLFFNNFYFSTPGALIEYFDDDLIPLGDYRGQVTEPGHHFEWVWLLNRYKEISSRTIPQFNHLYNFAHSHGINPHVGLLWGEVSKAGAPLSSTVRLWPHTEWLKAELVINIEHCQPLRITKAWSATSRFLDHPQPGLWYETFDHEKRSFLPAPSPASSLYHIVLAIDSLNKFTNLSMRGEFNA